MYAAYFPITENNPALCDTMKIAMGYLRESRLADEFVNPECLAAAAISAAWARGVRHPIRLANEAIVCAERMSNWDQLPNLFTMLV
jgi:hypothetical protein